MRKFKFRVWDKEEEKMYDVHSLDVVNLMAGYWDKEKRYGFPGMDDFPVELMQYTGLKDCYGKEIYEGDIVSVSLRTGDDLFVIKFGDGMFYGENEQFDVCASDLGDMEVIGNIYENKDLLSQ